MSWRSIMISRPARLRVKNRALHIEQEQGISVPLEDIAVILLGHPEITLSHPVLSACAEHRIALFSTGPNFHPNGIFLSYLQHHRSTRFWRMQHRVPRPLAKQLWAMIVRQKIENQARCLKMLSRSGGDLLDAYSARVRSGDSNNMESVAAVHYFSCLFGKQFSRKHDTRVNSLLNYGYAVLRGAVAREIVTHGLHPSVGLCHDSEQNAFNLADDFIEPFRPQIDLHVATIQFKPSNTSDLSSEDKAQLVSLLNVDIGMPRGTMSVLSSIDQVVESAVRVYELGTSPQLLELPMLIGLDSHLPDT